MTADRNPSRPRRFWSRALLATSLVGAGYLLWQGRDDLRRSADIGFAVLGMLVALQVLYLVSQSERLRLIVSDHTERKMSGLPWMRVFYVGRFLNSILMQSGNVFRFAALRRRYGISSSQFASSLATQTWLSVASSVGMASVLSIFAQSDFGLTPWTPVALAGLTLLILTAPFLARLVSGHLLKTRGGGRVKRAIDGILERITQTVASPRLLVLLTFNIAVGFATGAAILVLAYRSAGVALPWFMAAIVLALLQVSNIIVLTPGNLGVQELGFAALTGILGYSGAAGVVASAAVRVSGLIAVALCAGLIELGYRTSRSKAAG